MALLEIIDICKAFGGERALDGVSLDLERHAILGLLGPSGCGKTTLLRIIAGLESADRGEVRFDGRDIGPVAPHRRQFGMMFQEFALFPHKNVFENVAFGLHLQNLSIPQVAQQTEEVLKLVGLHGFARRNVDELSGGERQRVALARSLAPHPRLLMLDEPLGALDRGLRERLMLDLRRILKRVGVTAIFVTHDQAEAFAIADEVAVFHRGRIQQIDRPDLLYQQPANEKVARFLGFHNLLPGTVAASGGVQTPIGLLNPATSDLPAGARVTVLVRPEAARPISAPAEAGDQETVLQADVKDCLFRGRSYHLTVETTERQRLIFEYPAERHPPRLDQSIYLALRQSAMQVMPASPDATEVEKQVRS